MNTWMEFILKPAQDPRLTGWFLDALLKSIAVLTVAGGICALWRRASAATRHQIWLLAVVSLPCLFLLNLVLPAKPTAVWSVATRSDADNMISLKLDFAPANPLASTAAAPQTPPPTTPESSPVSKPFQGDHGFTAHFGTNWLAFGLAVWGIGAVTILLTLGVAQIRLRRVCRRALPLSDNGCATLLAQARETLGLTRVVVLLQSADNVMPLTCGWWRPVVLLPGEADHWPMERRKVVLLHELAHVKRRDCLTQLLAQVVCAVYWFNPLVWLAARQMCIERERACDDLVLSAGCKASDYAGHLVEIAGNYRRGPQLAAIAMARPAGLSQRVEAILDTHRNRGRIAKLAVLLLTTIFLSLGWLIGGYAAENPASAWTLKDSKVDGQLKRFIAEKQAQEAILIKSDEADFAERYKNPANQIMRPDCGPFFDAAENMDWLAVSNLWSDLEAHTLGLSKLTNGYPHGMWLQPLRETYGAVEAFTTGNGKYSEMFADDIIQSIPPGSIYFGGTDPGRFIITAMEKSQIAGEPFFILTQNALADMTYLEYLRSMYAGKIYIPTGEDSQRCFEEYMKDAVRRLNSHQLKPGEDVKISDGRTRISGRVAVMAINGLLVKTIFDRETNRDFYIEESFPLDWMYPYLEPHGLIFKINRESLPELSETMVRQDREYWQPRVTQMIGGWLDDDTSVKAITDFAEKVFLRHDLSGFTGDPEFVQNDYANKMFSKLRSSIAGLYAWRAEHATVAAEKERMARAADFAFRQALALCPGNPEAVERYTAFLKSQDRAADAQLVQELGDQFKPKPPFFQIRLAFMKPEDDAEKMIDQSINPATDRVYSQELYVQKAVLLDQTAIQSAQVAKDVLGHWVIDITLTEAGGKQFARITREHLHQRLAIVIDGKLMTAPVINSEISGGKCEISGSFSEAEANALVAKINEAIAR